MSEYDEHKISKYEKHKIRAKSNLNQAGNLVNSNNLGIIAAIRSVTYAIFALIEAIKEKGE